MWEAHTKNLTFHGSISVCYQIPLYFTETQTIQTQNTHTLVDMGYLPRRNLHTVQVKHPHLNLWQWILTFLKRNHSCLSFLSYLYRLQSCWQSTIWAGPFQLLTVIFIAIVSYLFHIKIKLRWRGSDIPNPYRNTQVVRQRVAVTEPTSYCWSSSPWKSQTLLVKPSFHLHFPHTDKLSIPKPDSADALQPPYNFSFWGPFPLLKLALFVLKTCFASERHARLRGRGWASHLISSHLSRRERQAELRVMGGAPVWFPTSLGEGTGHPGARELESIPPPDW